MNELQDSISKMIVNGNRLELPSGFFDNYADVKKALVKAGGKYKKNGFEYTVDPQSIKDRLVCGETVNDKKEFQFFETPDKLARKVIELANINKDSRVLEPSAGQGALSNLAMEITDNIVVVEIMPDNIKSLASQGYDVIDKDFLSLTEHDLGLFDVIIANPPFTKNQDIEHIRHMYSMLKGGGKVVSIASRSWITGSQKKQQEFRDWLNSNNAILTDIDSGEFKESGTSIATVLIEIIK